MLKKTSELKVKPVLKYDIPKYPSFYDNYCSKESRNILNEFKGTSLIIASALSIASLMVLNADEEGKEKTANPFPISSSGLPHHSSPYGTGAPSRLNDKAARAFIKQIFEEEGIKLKEGVKFKNEKVEFEVSGYNEDKKIGFVFGDYSTLDEVDAIKGWSDPNPENDLTKEFEEIEEKTASYVYFNNKYGKELKEIFKEADKKKRAKSLQDLYVKFRKKESEKKLSLAEAKELEKDAIKNKEFIAVISTFDNRLTFYHGSITEKDLAEVMAVKDKKKREQMYKKLLDKNKNEFFDEKPIIQVMDLEENVRKYIQWAKSQGL